eukprot:m.452207 g.452207  ORF g.452207 m.452207 type:complete len:114 (-) comp20286_c0_seq1:8-349(-)
MFQLSGKTGGANRRSPIGGLANGMPLHIHVPLSDVPCTAPLGVLTTSVFGTSSNPCRAIARALCASALRNIGPGTAATPAPIASTAKHAIAPRDPGITRQTALLHAALTELQL